MNLFQQLYRRDLNRAYSGFEGIIFDNVIGDVQDLQSYFAAARKEIGNTKILISYHNPLWEPVLNFASTLGLRKKLGEQNWIDREDLKNILELAGFTVISSQMRFFGITTITIAKPLERNATRRIRKYTVSIIVPAKNESGNIAKIIPSIPKFGKSQEFIFIEGGSKDNTWGKIIEEKRKRKNVSIFKQPGKGKSDAVWFGLKKATGDILITYDADRTVDANDLPKFYAVLASNTANRRAFANGNRLLYPMTGDAMRTLNKIGNQFFSWLFTWILSQRFKDTLCGTKAFFRKDFVKFRKSGTDPFGDFDLIFGAIRNRLRVVEIPVRYKERVYGSTNINRFRHGLLLFKMTLLALVEFKL